MQSVAGLVLLAIVLGACKTSAVGQAPTELAVSSLFGPVIGGEVIGGRAEAGDDVLLLAGGMALIRIDVEGRRFARLPLRVFPGDSCWGLARLAAGRLWTLKSRRTLARIDDEGSIVDDVPLGAPHFGVFAAGDRLVFQEAAFNAPAPALQIGSADGRTRAPWSAITTRAFDRLARASAAVLNMVSCGASRTRERACWFPDEAAVSLVDVDGHTRRLPLAGLHVVSPEALLTSDNPARPVRDAFVDGDGNIWVLSTGTPPGGARETPGGWILARFGPTGNPTGQSRLAEAARLILRVDRDRVVLLLSSGMVGEVRTW